ncbi:MAG: GNAT family N-acetyltransferase [Dehalococcoidales bacterium]|nr:GNAT family N-acetyltransferase [Dehalococcoidales bacterium]
MFLETDIIGLRQLEEDDLPQMRDWRNSPIIRGRTREYLPLNMINQKKWFASLDSKNIMFAIIEKKTGKFIGVTGLVHIDYQNRIAEYSHYIGNPETRGKGYSRHVAYLVFEYAFGKLGLHKVWGEIYTHAPDILNIDKKLGFKHDATIRDTNFSDGKYWGSHIISILDTEWEKLRENYIKERK